MNPSSLFEFKIPTRLVFGLHAVDRLPEVIASLSLGRVLVVTDTGVMAAGLLDRAVETLKDKGIEWNRFDGVEANPSLDTVTKGAECFRETRSQGIVAIGGGSVIDAAKAIGVGATHEGAVRDYTRDGGKPLRNEIPPLIALPTTAGTGSEVTLVSVLSDPEKRKKMAIASPSIAPRVALVDPEMTRTLPPAVTAATGMDALTHAIEAYTSIKSTPISDALALKAVSLIGDTLPRAVANGDNMAARAAMMLGATIAGAAFANSSTGLVHSLAHGLWGQFDMAHGMGNAVMLPVVMRFNRMAAAPRYRDIAAAMGEPVEGLSESEAALQAVAAVERLLDDIGLPRHLGHLKVDGSMLEHMADHAMGQKGSFPFNIRKPTRQEVIGLYRSVFETASS